MRLIELKMKRVSVKNSTEGYTSETWQSMSSGVLLESQHIRWKVSRHFVSRKELLSKHVGQPPPG